MEQRKLYRSLKWLWLVMQAAILPVAARFAMTREHISWPGRLPSLLLSFGGAFFLIFWLIAQALVAMARFPLRLSAALSLVGGTLAQLLFLVFSGASLGHAVYSVFFATLAAVVACVCLLAGLAIKRRTLPPAAMGAVLLFFPLAVAFLLFALAPLLPDLAGLPPLQRALEWTFLAVNSGQIVFHLFRLSSFAAGYGGDPDAPAMDREWERWAAPTIILLILSATAAIMVVALSRN